MEWTIGEVRVLIAYFDEVKYEKDRSPYYWLGAIVADADLIWTLERQVNDLAEDVFGTRMLTRDTEFHASAIMNAHGHFKGWDLNPRIDLMKRLTSIFGSAPGLAKVYVRMNPAKMVSSNVEDMAFMFLVERVDGYLRQANSPGVLIGDRENETIAGQFAENLSAYRANGTKFEYGQELTYLLDTVHFTHSHHSRMLQLADLHTWLRQLCEVGDQGKWHRKEVISHVASIEGCLSSKRYKEWPTDASRIKVT